MAYSNYQTYAATTTGAQSSVNLDPAISPFGVTAAVWVVSGSASFSVQWSFDDYGSVSDANARWFNDPIIPSGTATSIYTNFTTPATRVRLNIASNSGGLEFKVLQGFAKN